MASDGDFESDKDVGLTIALGALAIGSALVALAAPGTELAAWGFAAAMTFGALLVVAVHVYAPGWT